ncbi:pyridoxal phosphate homeostasis protein isoform X2 [Rhodnius prolixus]|uniref:pyridoxal phosphate homeostasis protein isoform X2 n=1 Tax=Rhodnius prolixus TaxID=13249 RepID=UPI003D18D4C9
MIKVIIKGLASVCSRINAVCLKNGLDFKPRLVAVSKTKSKELIISAYAAGQRNFGENYIQELSEKSNDAEILEKCKDIKWHFIGNLQRNKVNKLVSSPGLYLVETVDSEKLASALDTAWQKLKKEEPLRIMVQVNTSREEEKGGCDPKKSCDLVEFVIKSCPSLKFIGLMTIGKYGYDVSKGPNPDFLALLECRDNVCAKLNFNPKDVELSMGMSDDFEQAIELGSTSVRVGTAIFGHREPKMKTETNN